LENLAQNGRFCRLYLRFLPKRRWLSEPGTRVIDQEEGFCRKVEIQAPSVLDPGDGIRRSCRKLTVFEGNGIDRKAIQRDLTGVMDAGLAGPKKSTATKEFSILNTALGERVQGIMLHPSRINSLRNRSDNMPPVFRLNRMGLEVSFRKEKTYPNRLNSVSPL
jgi:hypothetical protein